MLQGLRTAIYPVSDLGVAKQWYAARIPAFTGMTSNRFGCRFNSARSLGGPAVDQYARGSGQRQECLRLGHGCTFRCGG